MPTAVSQSASQENLPVRRSKRLLALDYIASQQPSTSNNENASSSYSSDATTKSITSEYSTTAQLSSLSSRARNRTMSSTSSLPLSDITSSVASNSDYQSSSVSKTSSRSSVPSSDTEDLPVASSRSRARKSASRSRKELSSDLDDDDYYPRDSPAPTSPNTSVGSITGYADETATYHVPVTASSAAAQPNNPPPQSYTYQAADSRDYRRPSRLRVRWRHIQRMAFARNSSIEALQRALRTDVDDGGTQDWQEELDNMLSVATGDVCFLEPLEFFEALSDDEAEEEAPAPAAAAVQDEEDEEKAIQAIIQRRRGGRSRRDSIDIALAHGLRRIRQEITGDAGDAPLGANFDNANGDAGDEEAADASHDESRREETPDMADEDASTPEEPAPAPKQAVSDAPSTRRTSRRRQDAAEGPLYTDEPAEAAPQPSKRRTRARADAASEHAHSDAEHVSTDDDAHTASRSRVRSRAAYDDAPPAYDDAVNDINDDTREPDAEEAAPRPQSKRSRTNTAPEAAASSSKEPTVSLDEHQEVCSRLEALQARCAALAAETESRDTDLRAQETKLTQMHAQADEQDRTRRQLQEQISSLRAELKKATARAEEAAASASQMSDSSPASGDSDEELSRLRDELAAQTKAMTKLQTQAASCKNSRCPPATRLRVELNKAQRLSDAQKEHVADVMAENEAMQHELNAVKAQCEEQLREMESRLSTMSVDIEGQVTGATSAGGFRIQQLEKMVDEWQSRCNETEARLHDTSKRLLSSEASTEALRGELESANISHKVVRQQLESAQANYAKLSTNYERLQSDFRDQSKQLSQLQDTHATTVSQLSAARAETSVLQHTLSENKQTLKQTGDSTRDMKDELLSARAQLALLQTQQRQVESSQAALIRDKSRADVELDRSRQELASLKETSDRQAQENAALRAELETLRATLAEQQRSGVEQAGLLSTEQGRVSALTSRVTELEGEAAHLRRVESELETEVAELMDEIAKAEQKTEAARAATEALGARHASELADLAAEITRLKDALRGYEDAKQSKDDELRQRDGSVAQQAEQIESLRERIAELEEDMESQRMELQAEADRLRAQAEAADEVRRVLHNQLIDLRGNIRVFCRIRPASNPSSSPFTVLPQPQGSTHQALQVNTPSENVYGSSSKSHTRFKFDHVFAPGNTQEALFAELSGFVTSVLDGYNTAVFAYGQTGSGKTHTMMGPESCFDREALGLSPDRGVIPRTVEQIFEVIRKKSASNWRYCLKASFFEIYNDQVRDLLVSVPRPPAADGEDTFFVDDEAASTVSSNPNASTDVNNLRVSLAANGQVFVAGATIVPVFCADHVYSLIHYANANRSVAATAMNARSSRSHSVFQLHIQARFLGLPGKPSDGSTLSSTISLVDLAGSERLDKSKTNSSGRTNEHALKETQHINASLSSLTKCIQAIARKSEHVPYRDSKLTYLLKDSLGGTAKTLFFTNVAAEADHLSESLCTLRFAETLKNVELGSRLVNKGGQNKIKK